MKPSKKLSHYETFIAEYTWGGVPVDVDFVRNSPLFEEKKTQLMAGFSLDTTPEEGHIEDIREKDENHGNN